MKARGDPGPSVSASPHLFDTLVRSGLPVLTALGEAKENMGPGTDTTSATLAHVLWALAHNGCFQDELFQDLQRIGFASDMASLEGVHRLKACVKEGVRWAGAAAAMLPRVVPEGGVELHGTFLPEGVSWTASYYAVTSIKSYTLLTRTDRSHVVAHLVPARQHSIPQPRRVQPVPLAHAGRERHTPGRAAGQVLHSLFQGRQHLHRQPVREYPSII